MIFRSPLVVLDTETTGLPRDKWAAVIEIGAVLLDTDGTEVDHWTTLIRPDVLDERAAPALAVNHIDPADLIGQPSTVSALASWRGWLSQHGDPWVTAFNVGFDRPMLERSGWTYDRWASCVMLRSMPVMGVSRWPRLAAAAEHFGVVPDGDAHRALTDARTAARVAVEIRRREIAARGAA